MAETVEETFESEVTRKTVRTSYKIEEVSTLFMIIKLLFYDEIVLESLENENNFFFFDCILSLDKNILFSSYV